MKCDARRLAEGLTPASGLNQLVRSRDLLGAIVETVSAQRRSRERRVRPKPVRTLLRLLRPGGR